MPTNEKERVIVFDLNGTFYNKSSKDEFYKFMCLKRPKRVKFYFEMVYYQMLLKYHRINQTEFKENFFNYLDNVFPEQVEEYANEFWEKEYPHHFNDELKAHFNKMKNENVKLICATGALEVYVKPLFNIFSIDGLVGTRTNYTNGTYIVNGEACKGEEKIKRINQLFKGKKYSIIEAYSDSKEDILNHAEKAFLVKDKKIRGYNASP